MVAVLLALHAVSGLAPSTQNVLPGVVSESLAQALAVSDARVVALTWTAPTTCRVQSASVQQPITGSGRVAVKVAGKNCAAWGWAQIQVWAKVAVTTRPVRVGEALTPAVTILEREVMSGRPPIIPSEGAVAARSLPSGVALSVNDVSGSTAVVGAGESVKVLIASGAVAIEAQGRRIACLRNRACAVLATGKHVEGRWDERGRLIVELPQ